MFWKHFLLNCLGSKRLSRITIESYQHPDGTVQVYVDRRGVKSDTAVAIMLGMKADKITEKLLKSAVRAFEDPAINNFEFND